jgi:hypothetical protein
MSMTSYVTDDGQVLSVHNNCDETTSQPGAGPTPADILDAFRQIPLPDSDLVIQPPGGATLVNFATNFYTNAAPFERTVTLLGHRVHFTITPATYTWHFGDHTHETTRIPGAAYPALDVTHRYTRRGTATPSVDTTWRADYRLDNGPTTRVDGTVTIHGTPQRLTIKSATPTLVG